jgi:hypothetical protein
MLTSGKHIANRGGIKRMKIVHDYLVSPSSKQMRSKRLIEIGSVFGKLKQDWEFQRFLLRGKEKVLYRRGLCMAHKIAKAAV